MIDQEIQLLNTQIININEQISAYNLLIADKQDELDTAEDRLETLNQENKERIRTMEEEGEVSYWEVIFKANSFSDLLDRLNMVEEIAASDKRRLQELSDAANKVEEAQDELEAEKVELEDTKKDLDDTQAEMNEKNKESEALLQELLQKADDLQALEEECKEQENAFLKQIAAMGSTVQRGEAAGMGSLEGNLRTRHDCGRRLERFRRKFGRELRRKQRRLAGSLQLHLHHQSLRQS
ncbi:MAG: coiled-coil domain-containing protein [Oscillospiraceae bacterium]